MSAEDFSKTAPAAAGYILTAGASEGGSLQFRYLKALIASPKLHLAGRNQSRLAVLKFGQIQPGAIRPQSGALDPFVNRRT